MISRSLLRVVEVVSMRAGPGLLNVATLVQLAAWLSPAQFGAYSTTLVAIAFAAGAGFGPLTFSIVSQYAGMAQEGRESDYVAAIATLVAGAALLLTVAALGLAAAGLAAPSLWVLAVAAAGAHAVLQEVLRAKLRLWSFGASSAVQSACYFGFAWGLVGEAGTVADGLIAFSLSYGVAVACSLGLLGFPPLWRPRLSILAASFRVGRGYTLANITENALELGLRYGLISFATPQALAIYAFAVDLAQRLVGFLISAASFTFVPQAFRDAASGDTSAFRSTLLRGAAIGLGLAAASAAAVLVLSAAFHWPDPDKTPFDAIAFCLVAAAVALNRLKKLIADPFAMRADRTVIIALGYALAIAAALPVFGLGLLWKFTYVAEFAILAAFLTALAVSLLVLRRELLGSPAPRR